MAFITMVALTLVSFILIRLLLDNRRQQHTTKPQTVRQAGCEDPPQYPHKDPAGQDLVELSTQAYQEHRFLDFTSDLFEEHGRTFSTISDGKLWIRTQDPQLSKAIYATFFENFGLEPIRYEDKNSFFGDGILVVDGARWKHARGLIKPAFEIAHVANFDRLERHVGRFLDVLPQDGSTVNLLPILKRLVSERMCLNSVSHAPGTRCVERGRH
jgi:cytochrome P450